MSKAIDKKRIASLAVFALGVLLVLYYILAKERIEFDSDFTDTILWADAMLTGNGLFDKTMNYAYTLPFGGSLIMAPFVAMFGVGYKAHALGFVVFLAIFAFVLYKFMRAMDFSIDMSLVCSGLVLILSLPTKNTRMIMWGHVIHYSLGLLFVMAALAIFRKIDVDKGVKDNKVWVIVLAVFTALCCTNGLTTILFFFVPFLGALILERFVDINEDLKCAPNINTLIIVSICGVTGFFGFVLSKIAQRGVTTVYDDMFKNIQSWQNWVWDFEDRVRCILVLCAGGIESDVPMESLTGIRILYMAMLGFVILIVPLVACISYKRIENAAIKIFIISYYILLFSSLFIYDFSMARGTAHRLVGIYMTAVIVTVVYAAWLIKEKELSRFGVVLAVILTGAALFSMYSLVALKGENRYDRLARVLEENNLKYGYAEYWSAQVTTVLSDNMVDVSPVFISDEGAISPRLYNIRNQQFDDRDDVDRYFVFMSAWEYEVTNNTVRQDAIEEIPFDEDGYIVVFDHNIF